MMADIEAKIKKTEATIDHLKKSMADPKDIEKARKELRTYQKQLDEMKSAMEGVNQALSDINLATPRQLERALRTLNRQLKDMQPGSETWDSHVEKIRELKERLADLKGELKEQESLWGKFKNWASDVWPSIDLLSRGYDTVVSGLREYVDAFASMDQEMANVRKFTGMTEDQVASLNERFRSIDTRSSREQLNKLAQEAGRLGKTSEEDVLGFVRAADKINVALDDLGEGATLTLSKLTGIFGDEERYGTEQALLKVGSVINELSQNCSASAPYLAQFASRLGGIGSQAGMTIQQIMGFGAVLDSNAQALEASSTALGQVIVRLYQDPAKYARVAGIDVQRFTKLMREDANAALILFLDTLHKAGGMDNLSPMFKDMGENGSRAIAALSTLATHIDQVKAQQQAANVAFSEGVSIDKEFSVQNSTVEASLEKCRNAANELRVELGERLYPLMSHFLSTSAAVMRAALMAVRFLMDHKEAVISLAAATSAYLVVVNLHIIKSKALAAAHAAEIALTKAANVVILLLSAAYSALTGNLVKARGSMMALNAVVKANPLGLLVSALTAAITWITLYISKTKEAARAEREAARERARQIAEFRSGLRDLSKASSDYAEKEILALKKSYEAATDDTRAKKERLAAVADLQRQYPAYFGQLSTEAIMVGEASDKYEALTANIFKAAKARAAQDKIYENEKLRLEKEMELDQTQTNIEDTASQRDRVLDSYSGKLNSGSWKKAREAKALRPELDGLNQSLADAEQTEARLIGELAEIDRTNEWLADRYGADLDEIQKRVKAEAEKPSDILPSSGPYQSSVQADKDRKISETEARRALAKANKAFKDRMNGAKGDWEAESAQNISEYGQGLKSYEQFLTEKERLDLRYLDARIEIYDSLYDEESEQDKKLLLMYDEDYQEFLLKRAELVNKHAAAESKRKVEDLQREYKMEVAMAEFEFNSSNSGYYGNAQAQQQRLFELKIEYLTKYKRQYQSGSREWTEYERQIQEAEQERILQKKKSLVDKYEDFVASYTSMSAKRRYEIELAMVEELHSKMKISEQQYQIWLAELRKKYRKEASDAELAASDARFKVDGPGGKSVDTRTGTEQAEARVEALKAQRQAAIDELQARFDNGLIDNKQFRSGLNKINSAYQEELFDPVRQGIDEQTRMLLDLGLAWADFFRSIRENGEITWNDVTDIAKNSVAVLCAGLQSYSEFLEAQSRVDQANVTKRYEAEIKAAQGNSYKTSKLEKKKEDDLQKIKAEYARKEFAVKVIMAVAQTAQNALLGYAAGLQAGFPMALWLAPSLAGLAAAQGAVQIALLKKQQQAAAAEGYADGGFTGKGGKYEPAGIVHKGEWVASQELLASPVARPMIEALDLAQRTNTIGSLRADDVSRSITAGQSLVRMSESDNGSLVMAAVASQMSSVVAELTDRLREPFVTVNTVSGDHGMQQAQDEYVRLMNNKSPKSRRYGSDYRWS
ncbi:MAG: phage tail tape measure protein [Roseburia sp.]|nr:phage tail tape measure protein [Roseburia sp.]